MPLRTVFNEPVPERATRFIQGYLLDQNDDPIAPSRITALTLTLYELSASRFIVNLVDHVSILNVGRGTLGTDGFLVVELTSGDNTLIDATRHHEAHRALIEWTYDSTRSGKHEVEFIVQNLDKVA